MKIQSADHDVRKSLIDCEAGAQCVVVGRRVKGAGGEYLMVEKFSQRDVVEVAVPRSTKRVFPKLFQEVSAPQLIGSPEKSAGVLLFHRNRVVGKQALVEAGVPTVLKDECDWYYSFEAPIVMKDGARSSRVFGIAGKSNPEIAGNDPLRVAMIVEDDGAMDVAWVIVRGGDGNYLSLGGDHETDEWTRLEVTGQFATSYPFLEPAFQRMGEERAKIYADHKVAVEAERRKANEEASRSIQKAE